VSVWAIVGVSVLGALVGSAIVVGLLMLLAGPPWWYDGDGDEDTRL